MGICTLTNWGSWQPIFLKDLSVGMVAHGYGGFLEPKVVVYFTDQFF